MELFKIDFPYTTRKMVPIKGELGQSLKSTYVRFQKQSRKEKEETETMTFSFPLVVFWFSFFLRLFRFLSSAFFPSVHPSLKKFLISKWTFDVAFRPCKSCSNI